MDGKLAGKVAVITGGSSGIGLATAKLFHDEGAQVVIIGRNEAKLEAARVLVGEDTLLLVGDVAKPADLARAMHSVRDHFGRIDVLFANAGMSECPPFQNTDEAFFDEMFGANVKGVFFSFTQALPFFSDGASAIFTCSISHDRGSPGDPLYSATKAAVRSLARTLASEEEVLDRGIRVNVVSPGAIKTPLTTRDDPEEEEQINEYIERNVPMARWGLPEEIAKAVLFLACSDSSYMTGGEIAVDGGLGQI